MSDPKYINIGTPEDKIIEELSEVIKEICKARRFGYFNFHPAEPETLNIDRIRREIDDCIEAFEYYEIYLREILHNHFEVAIADVKKGDIVAVIRGDK